ncbi:hypothetical protein RIF29_20879 [Crotalaria pallida]|uniref:Uncharacterized protein n=1 Tax=Crotalaria pallida TaxID=3830 RepID=A0AAN9FAH8_CROPI
MSSSSHSSPSSSKVASSPSSIDESSHEHASEPVPPTISFCILPAVPLPCVDPASSKGHRDRIALSPPVRLFPLPPVSAAFSDAHGSSAVIPAAHVDLVDDEDTSSPVAAVSVPLDAVGSGASVPGSPSFSSAHAAADIPLSPPVVHIPSTPSPEPLGDLALTDPVITDVEPVSVVGVESTPATTDADPCGAILTSVPVVVTADILADVVTATTASDGDDVVPAPFPVVADIDAPTEVIVSSVVPNEGVTDAPLLAPLRPVLYHLTVWFCFVGTTLSLIQ